MELYSSGNMITKTVLPLLYEIRKTSHPESHALTEPPITMIRHASRHRILYFYINILLLILVLYAPYISLSLLCFSTHLRCNASSPVCRYLFFIVTHTYAIPILHIYVPTATIILFYHLSIMPIYHYKQSRYTRINIINVYVLQAFIDSRLVVLCCPHRCAACKSYFINPCLLIQLIILIYYSYHKIQ